MHIKEFFNVKYEVREYYYDEKLGHYLRNNQGIEMDDSSRFLYTLTLGSQLFNEMI